MKIGLVGNVAKIKNPNVVEEFERFLNENGYQPVVFSSNAEIDGVDVLIVLGGDGAILHAATVAAPKGIKVIGVNYGNLGFLAEYEKSEQEGIVELLKSLEEGQARILKRSLLSLNFDGNTYYALNEVGLQRHFDETDPYQAQILRLRIEIDDLVDTIAGDGLLISTPTGSTAYSLSAGGAILTPEVPALMMTPICAFSLQKRPIVFPDSEVFHLRAERGKALVLVDGKAVGYLKAGELLEVKKAPFAAEFPVRDQSDFFGKIKNKLN